MPAKIAGQDQEDDQRDKGADHEDIAMGEVDHADDAVDHRVADRDQAIDRSQRQPVDKLLDEIFHCSGSPGMSPCGRIPFCFPLVVKFRPGLQRPFSAVARRSPLAPASAVAVSRTLLDQAETIIGPTQCLAESGPKSGVFRRNRCVTIAVSRKSLRMSSLFAPKGNV
jgi:hypothetical protein